MSKDIGKQVTIGLERNYETVNQDSGEVNATTENNTNLQGKSNTPDTNSNDRSRNSSHNQGLYDNEKLTEEQREILCPKEGETQNESWNKEAEPDTNTIGEHQVFSDAKCETVEDNTNEDEIIIQIIAIEQRPGEPPCGNGTEPEGNNAKIRREMKQEAQGSEEDPKIKGPTNEIAQTTNETIEANSQDEIHNLPTLDNTNGDTVQNSGDKENCTVEQPANTREYAGPILEENSTTDFHNHCVEPPPNTGDNSETIDTTGDKNNNCDVQDIVDPPSNIKENSTPIQKAGDVIEQKPPNTNETPEGMKSGDIENTHVDPSPSSVCGSTTSTVYGRCTTRYCYCCYCCRIRCCRCYCQACCRPCDNTAPAGRGHCQNCSRPNNEPTTPTVNEHTSPVCQSKCQNCSNKEQSIAVCDTSFCPKHTSSPLKGKSDEQNELEATPSKRRKLVQNEDPKTDNGTRDNYETLCEGIKDKNRDNDGDNTLCETCHDDKRCETCERQSGYDSGYCEQSARQNGNRCDNWANNKATQTDDECIVNPNEKSTQTCFADVIDIKDEEKTFMDDRKVFGERSWAADRKANPTQTGKLGKQSFGKQHSDELLHRNDTQPPAKKKRGNKDTGKYEQYHHNAYLNYYVRLFREERFQGMSASEVAKYAGYEWRSRMSEEEKRPYYEMRKLAPPRSSGAKNRKKRRWWE